MALLSNDLENWMSNLSRQIRDEIPVINLAIPGSHDSCTYGMSNKSLPAPDAEDIVRKLYNFVPCVVRRWAKTQTYTISDQLSHGIRFFDLRVALNAAKQQIYFVHGVFCEEITEPFKELKLYLKSHPNELVILDFQHFYDFGVQHHKTLINTIMQFFEDKIVERSCDDSNMKQITLTNACSTGKQMIVIYRNDTNVSNEFFRSYDFPTPWPNVTNIPDLKDFLVKRLGCRSPTQGFVSQCLLTPDVNFIIPRFYSTLRKTCAKKVDAEMSEWLQQQTPGVFKEGDAPKTNVFLADFIDIRDSNFCKIIVDLNMKL